MDRFLALSDPTRRRIIEMLGERALPAGEIGGQFSVSPPAISQHLKVLREAGLVRITVDGQRRIYSLEPDGLDEIEVWLRKVRGDWKQRLDDLERELSQPEGEKR